MKAEQMDNNGSDIVHNDDDITIHTVAPLRNKRKNDIESKEGERQRKKRRRPNSILRDIDTLEMNNQTRIVLDRYIFPCNPWKDRKEVREILSKKMLILLIDALEEGNGMKKKSNDTLLKNYKRAGIVNNNNQIGGSTGEIFRKMLLDIVIDSFSLPLPECIIDRKSLISPRIITELGSLFLSSSSLSFGSSSNNNNNNNDFSFVGYLFDIIEDDQVFVIMSLAIGMYMKYFIDKKKKNKKKDTTTDGKSSSSSLSHFTTTTNTNNTSTLEFEERKETNSNIDFIKDFVRIKKRWIIFEDLLHYLFCNQNHYEGDDDDDDEINNSDSGRGMNELEKEIVRNTTNQIKSCIFNRMLQGALSYSQITKNQEVIELTNMPLDASFASYMINKTNFDQVTRVVEETNVITFFGTFDYYNDSKNYNVTHIYYDCLYQYPTTYSLSQESRIDDNDKRSEVGISWKHKVLNVVVRDFLLKDIISKTFDAFTDMKSKRKKEDEKKVSIYHIKEMNKQKSIEIGAQRLEELCTDRLNILQVYKVLTGWDVSLQILLQFFHNYKCYLKSLRCVTIMKSRIDVQVKWLGWLLDRIIMDMGGFENIPENDMDDALEVMLYYGLSDSYIYIIETYKRKFTPKRIKHLSMIIVNHINCVDYRKFGNNFSNNPYHLSLLYALRSMLDQYPWLLNTWVDHDGKTLLDYCMSYLSPIHMNVVLCWDTVQRYINVESRNGSNLLFAAANRCNNAIDSTPEIVKSIVTVGRADVGYVNSRHESVLHYLAASNGFGSLPLLCKYPDALKEIKSLLELRRKRDGATALMIALVRENLDVAHELLNLGALATTRFGRSQNLTTVEALLLKRKWLSIELLASRGIKPNHALIRKSLQGGFLFDKEFLIGSTGLVTDRCVTDRITSTGDITYRYRKKLGYTGNRRYVNHVKKYANKRYNVVDFTWLLFGDERDCSILGWPKRFLMPLKNTKNNKNPIKDEYEKFLKECINIYKDFGNEQCSICLRNFYQERECGGNEEEEEEEEEIMILEEEGELSMTRGVTDCGHAFHKKCWESLHPCDKYNANIHNKVDNKCPVCRKSTSFYIMSSNIPEDPRVDIPNEKIRTARRFREKITSFTDNDRYTYPKIPRYEFFIDGKWIDESSPLNVLS